MITVYLSSTYEDLKEYREVVYKALKKSGYDVIAMEDYVATDARPVDKCLADVSRADVYVGIFAFRYGYVPPESHGNPDKLSITELEFRHAQSLSKPCLTFVVNESKAWPPMFDDARKVEDKGERIDRLRQHLLTEKLASPFAEPYELACLVQAAITAHLKDSNRLNTVGGPIQVTTPVTWDIKTKGSPYPSLMHFTRKYAPVFFGREDEVIAILDRMHGPEGRFMIVSGDSGIGKSSVVDAGVLPRLEDGSLPGGGACEAVRMVPGQGNQPFAALMTALGSYAARAGLRPDAVVDELKRSPETFAEQIRKITLAGTNGKPLVLFIDQMEELFTAQDIEASNTFLKALYQAAQEKALWVIATIRSDHLHFCYRHPEMLSVLKGPGHYPLGRVETNMMLDMIMKPAVCAGLTISDTLARRIANDTLSFRNLESSDSDSANLPLLAFVLDQLFAKRSDHRITGDAYNTMGGIAGAITEHVKTVEGQLRKISGAKTGDQLSKIFHSLVNIKSEDAPPTRNRPRFVDFSLELHQPVKILVDARLLRTEGEGEGSTVSISHEKLFEAWPSLREYISVNKKSLMDQMLLNARARKWADLGKPWFSSLASCQEARDFRRNAAPSMVAKEFLNASSRSRWIIGGTVVFLSVIAALFFYTTKLKWQYELTTAQALLKLRSYVMSIHLEPGKNEMVIVSKGSFYMTGFREEGTRYVEIKKPFKLGKYEVTFDEYDRFAIDTGRKLPKDWEWGRGRRPVVDVSVTDAKAYTQWLSKKTGKSYRLPSEAEWEYAARSGGTDDAWAGTDDELELSDFAVFGATKTALVGSKKVNKIGLHDMSGNVWEWVEDCWHDSYRYKEAPTDGRAWKEENRGDCRRRVALGGSWGDTPVSLRSSSRDWKDAGSRSSLVGFRLAQDLD